MTVGSVVDERVRTTSERILHLIRFAIAVGILLTLVDLYRWLYLLLILAVAWGIIGIISVVIFRKGREAAGSCKKRSIGIGVAVLLAIMCVMVAVIQGMNDRKHKVDLVETSPTMENLKVNGFDL